MCFTTNKEVCIVSFSAYFFVWVFVWFLFIQGSWFCRHRLAEVAACARAVSAPHSGRVARSTRRERHVFDSTVARRR